MGAALPIIGGVIGGGLAYAGAREQAKTIKHVAGQVYQLKYLTDIDKLVSDLIKQQTLQQPEWSKYQQIVNQILGTFTPEQYQQYLNKYLKSSFQPTSSDLYKYYLDQLLQDVRSGLTARGLNLSPIGAGIESKVITDYAMQNLLYDWQRQSQALQNYLAGMSGLSNLGKGALQTALALEQLKSGWYEPAIQYGLQYMGLGIPATQARASILANLIPQAGQEWAQLGQVFNSVFPYLTQGTSTTPSYNVGYSSGVPVGGQYIQGTLNYPTFGILSGFGYWPGIGYVIS